MSNDEQTSELIQRWEASAQAAATPPDPAEARETFGQIISEQLSRLGTSL